MLKLIPLVFLGAFALNATTYYVSPSGNDAQTFNSMVTPWRTLDRASNAPLKAGDQVLLQRGGTWREGLYPFVAGVTYGAYGSGARPIISGASLLSSGWVAAGTNVWAINLSTAPTQVWFNGVLGQNVSSVSQVLAPLQWTYGGGVLTVYSKTAAASANIEAGQLDAIVAMSSVGNITFQSLHFSKSNAQDVFIGFNMTGTQTFQDVVWDGAAAEGIMALSGTLKITGSIGEQNAYGIGMYAGESLTLNNTILSGNANTALLLAGTTSPSVIQQSTISGNASRDIYAYVVENWSSQPLTATNSILLPNPYQPSSIGFDGVTMDSTDVHVSPAFTKRATPLIIVPYIDDWNNLAVAQAVASAAASYGFHISYALNTRTVTPDGWTAIRALQAAGTEIVAHTRTHSDLGSLDVMSIAYTGSATSATLSLNVGNNSVQTFLGNSSTPDLNIPLSSYLIALDLCNYINGRPGYSCSLPATQNWFNPVNLADVTNVDLKSGYSVKADPTRYYTYEIQGAKSDIAQNVPAQVTRTFATPYSSSSVAVESLIQGAGFELNRNGFPNDSSAYTLSHFNSLEMAGYWFPDSALLTDIPQSVAALVEGLGSTGGVYAVYSHGYDEFTLDQWKSFFASLKAVGGTCMTPSQVADYLKANGTMVPDGTNRYWNVPVAVTPNFAPTSASPTQGAHITTN